MRKGVSHHLTNQSRPRRKQYQAMRQAVHPTMFQPLTARPSVAFDCNTDIKPINCESSLHSDYSELLHQKQLLVLRHTTGVCQSRLKCLE